MKRTITILSLVSSALIILDSLQASHWFVLFIFAGVIPGTNLAVSAIDMMAATATAMTVVVLRLTVWPRIRESFYIAPVRPARAKRTRRTA